MSDRFAAHPQGAPWGWATRSTGEFSNGTSGENYSGINTDWLGDISKALASARVAVFLHTQNFLDSPFIREKELPVLIEAAQNRGCLIFVIAVSSSTFEDSPLAKFQWANPPNKPLDLMSDAEQSKTLTEIYRKMRAAVSVE